MKAVDLPGTTRPPLSLRWHWLLVMYPTQWYGYSSPATLTCMPFLMCVDTEFLIKLTKTQSALTPVA